MDYPDIKNYLEGKTQGEQSEQIRKWMTAPENETQVREMLGKIWINSRIGLTGDKPDFDVLLNKVYYRLGAKSNQSDSSKGKLIFEIRQLSQLFYRLAAILFIPLLILTAYLYFNRSFNKSFVGEPSIRKVYTKPGTRTKIELPDGTAVWLNDGTVLQYPEYFEGDSRQVFVDGEAYFEVKSNAKKPFIVNNPIMKTVVTGTHFNIYAYSSDNFFEATLLEGKIHLEGQAGIIDMVPGQRVQFDVLRKKVTKSEINTENAVAWIDGRLVIYNEKLESAIKKLGRWYNIEILMGDPVLSSYELTCTLENEKVEQCLKLISHALPIKYNYIEETKEGRIHYKIEFMRK